MEVTEVRIKLMEDGSERLKAFCSITFDDCFVVRDLKIIEGTSGPFVAMPSRKLTAHCGNCHSKNHLRAAHCNQCGQRLADDRAVKDDDGRTKLYADIAHPINSACREMIQARVIAEFEEEKQRAKQPGYISRYDDYDFDTPEPHIRPTAVTEERPQEPPPREVASGPSGSHSRVEPAVQDTPAPHPPHGRPTDRPSEAPSPAKKTSFGDGIL